jgi:protein SCO1/2
VKKSAESSRVSVSHRSREIASVPHPEDDDKLSPLAKSLVWLGACFAFFLVLIFGLLLVWSNPLGAPSQTQAAAPNPDGEPLVIPQDHPRRLVDFSLTDQQGRTIHRGDLQGKIVAVSFLFTSCDVVCPYVSAQMQKIQQATANLPNVRLLSITYDPADDTQQVLANYAHHFNADPVRWLFLTGDTNAVRALIKTSFLHEYSGEFAFPGVFENTQCIALVDPQGNIVNYFDGLNDKSGDAAIARIHKLESKP